MKFNRGFWTLIFATAILNAFFKVHSEVTNLYFKERFGYSVKQSGQRTSLILALCFIANIVAGLIFDRCGRAMQSMLFCNIMIIIALIWAILIPDCSDACNAPVYAQAMLSIFGMMLIHFQ